MSCHGVIFEPNVEATQDGTSLSPPPCSASDSAGLIHESDSVEYMEGVIGRKISVRNIVPFRDSDGLTYFLDPVDGTKKRLDCTPELLGGIPFIHNTDK